jgi:hypothetical protein
MLRNIKLFSIAAFASVLLSSCDSPISFGSTEPGIRIPGVNSEFVYDYEQHIIPVKKEDTDTTYRFELTAKVDQGDMSSMGELSFIRLYDETGTDMPHLRYRIARDEYGDIHYNQPYFSEQYTRLAFMSRESVDGPNFTVGDPSDYYQKLHQSTKYIGTEIITIGSEALECEVIEWTRSLTETDNITPGQGVHIETQKLWYAPSIGFFVKRTSDVTSSRLRKPKWKYTTTEVLKRYSIE